MLTHGVVLLHDNARPHTAACTRALLEHFKWELLNHLAYSCDLAPSEYHLFTCVKNWFGKQCFDDNEELMKYVKRGRAHKRQSFLTQANTNLLPDATGVSVPAVTTLRSSLSTRVFFIYNNFFLIAVFI
jgi:histone-lysine N-methyltransferase SETMAR